MSDPFFDQLLALIDDYLAKGCPCRFPRFRALVSRDTSRVAGGAFTSEEQRLLIVAYEKKVPLVSRRALEGWGGPMRDDVYQAECSVCSSAVERSSNEYAPGAWVEYLVIRRASGLVDLGAPVEHGRVFRPRPFVAMGPGMTGMHKAAQAYPFMEEEPWLAWMREPRAEAGGVP